jgi:hypothetical protein
MQQVNLTIDFKEQLSIEGCGDGDILQDKIILLFLIRAV